MIEAPAGSPLILTLDLHADDQARVDRLRQAHFPPDRNVIPAHLTLFHALPGDDAPGVAHVLDVACGPVAPFAIDVTGLRFLGRGVAYALAAPALLQLRGQLARHWHDQLTAQDRQGFRPHITIQNKAEPAAARALHDAMLAAFAPFTIRAEGLALWRYMGGPWLELGRHRFAAVTPPQAPAPPPGPRHR